MIQQARQDLSALFGSIGHWAIATFMAWGCTVLAFHAYPLAIRGEYAGAVGAAFIICLPALALACLLNFGARVFVGDATRLCLPGSRRFTFRSKLFASVLLIPALVLPIVALAGNAVWQSWVATVVLLAVALAEVLFALIPASAVGLLLLAVFIAYCGSTARTGHERHVDFFFAVLSGILALAAALTWSRAIRRGPRMQGLAARVQERMQSSRSEALLSAPQRAAGQHSSRDPLPPVKIIQTCLGGLFVQRPWPQLVLGAALLLPFLVIAIDLPRLGASFGRWVVSILGLIGAGVIATGFLARLSKLTREQLAELALMPGLGTPAAQRRALCRAVLVTPLPWLGIVLLFGSADLLIRGESLSSVGTLAVLLAIMSLCYTALALRKLAMLPPKPQSLISEFMLLFLMIYASAPFYWVYVVHPTFIPWVWFWMIPVLFGVGIASAIFLSARRLATAPHPFLC